MIVPTADGVWDGRDDGPGVEHRRWHSRVRPVTRWNGLPGLAVVGFASDEGVRRNRGRPGAAQGPDAIRRALAPMAVHTDQPLYDAGTVQVEGDDLEGAQSALADHVAELLDDGHRVVVLGGGHETAWGTHRGIVASECLGEKQVGVVNLDAHFDLREADVATSGTPFRQIADACAADGRGFRYLVLGIALQSNTRALFETADRTGTAYLTDSACTPAHIDRVLHAVDDFVEHLDVVHLSIDLDVLPADVAPGVSAPAAFGVPMETVEAVCRHVAGSGRLALVDVVELCPPQDVDARTARAAARLVSTITHALA